MVGIDHVAVFLGQIFNARDLQLDIAADDGPAHNIANVIPHFHFIVFFRVRRIPAQLDICPRCYMNILQHHHCNTVHFAPPRI